MFKPANIREFVTLAIHKKPVQVLVNGRTTKEYQEVGSARGKFKQKGSSEIDANGLFVVNTNTTYTTWYKASYEAKDVLTINGIDYEVVGEPENVEMRNRYSILSLAKISGGA